MHPLPPSRRVSIRSPWWLLLIFILQPPPPTVGPISPGKDAISALTYPFAKAVRAGTGLEVLRLLDRRTTSFGPLRYGDGTAGQQADGIGSPGLLQLTPSPILPPLVPVFRPLCERLPYDATAPPIQP